MKSQASDSLAWRFSLGHLFWFTSVVCAIAALYANEGIEGLFLGLIAWPLSIIAIGLIRRSRTLVNRGLMLQVVVPIIVLPFSIPPAIGQHGDPEKIGCQNSLKGLGLGIVNYYDGNRVIPARTLNDTADEALLSWRVAILPYVDQAGTYKKFKLNEAWDSKHNHPLLNELPDYYRCPADRASTSRSIHTSYLAPQGENTFWPDKSLRSLRNDIPDGLSQTALLVEGHSTGIAWSEPRDWQADMSQLCVNGKESGLSSNHGHGSHYFDGSRRVHTRTGCNMLMADGSVRYLSNDTDPEVLRRMLSRNDGKPVE